MKHRAPAPHQWLDGLVSEIRERWIGAPVEGAISGSGWASVRVGSEFLWLIVAKGERLAWIGDTPLSKQRLELLGRHSRSPFASHLREHVVEGAHVLGNAEGARDGLLLTLGPSPRLSLQLRVFPRPGAIWLDADGDERLAQLGRMEGDELTSIDPLADSDFDSKKHTSLCEKVLEERLLEQVQRTLRQQIDQRAKKLQRLVWTLEGDLKQAEQHEDARSLADLLAAHLHELKQGMESVALTDYEGVARIVELDPALSPAVNLDRWYKKAAKSERALEQVRERLGKSNNELASLAKRAEALDSIADTAKLDAWLEFAATHELDVVPAAPKPASERGKPDASRLPYWEFRIGSWELRVGRSAKDNDVLISKYAHGRDLWLHAQGVTGSHVVIRCAGKTVPKDVIEDAARVAAFYSKSKTSATVPVLLVERRYVRKPRKSPPGTVTVERAKTLFVEPGVPERCKLSS